MLVVDHGHIGKYDLVRGPSRRALRLIRSLAAQARHLVPAPHGTAREPPATCHQRAHAHCDLLLIADVARRRDPSHSRMSEPHVGISSPGVAGRFHSTKSQLPYPLALDGRDRLQSPIPEVHVQGSRQRPERSRARPDLEAILQQLTTTDRHRRSSVRPAAGASSTTTTRPLRPVNGLRYS